MKDDHLAGPRVATDERAGVPSVVLGHGASGTAASMRPWVEGLAARGIRGRAIDLPRASAERAVGVFIAAIEAEPAGATVVPGGHSFGGRVSSLAAARLFGEGAAAATDAGNVTRPGVAGPDLRRAGIAGLLLLSYPLHRPGAPETWRDRTAHWPALRCPVLLLSGESDPFARLELLHEAVTRLPDGRLVTYPRVGHGLAPVLEDALARAADFIRSLG